MWCVLEGRRDGSLDRGRRNVLRPKLVPVRSDDLTPGQGGALLQGQCKGRATASVQLVNVEAGLEMAKAEPRGVLVVVARRVTVGDGVGGEAWRKTSGLVASYRSARPMPL